jgi:hypothetical protein
MSVLDVLLGVLVGFLRPLVFKDLDKRDKRYTHLWGGLKHAVTGNDGKPEVTDE